MCEEMNSKSVGASRFSVDTKDFFQFHTSGSKLKSTPSILLGIVYSCGTVRCIFCIFLTSSWSLVVNYDIL